MNGRLSWVLLLLFTAACGYHPAGSGQGLPGRIDSLHVALFSNQTYEPFLETLVTDRVLAEFARRGDFRLVESSAAAEGELNGAVIRYRTEPIAYDGSDLPTEYRSSIWVKAVLRRNSDGRVLWKGEATWTEEYPAAADKALQERNEEAAMAEIADRIAEELHFRLAEDF